MVKPSSTSAAAVVGSASSMCEGDRNDANEAKYRGVRKRKWGKWVSEIRLPNSRERIWLGSYDSAEKAARAFDAALFCLRGNNANFNFPNQPPNIPGGTDLHPSQIQEVAAHYANSYSSTHDDDQLLQQPSDDVVSSNTYLQTSSSFMDVISSSSSCSFMMDYDITNNNDYNPNIHNIPDFGIFPGFDDYFMTLDHHHATFTSTADDYGSEEVVYDGGVCSEDPTMLWNF